MADSLASFEPEAGMFCEEVRVYTLLPDTLGFRKGQDLLIIYQQRVITVKLLSPT